MFRGKDVSDLSNSKIADYVNSITNDIDSRKNSVDLVVLENILNICLERDMIFEISEMYRNIAMHLFYSKQSGQAYDYMLKSIDLLQKMKIYDTLVQRLSELGLIYFFDLRYDEALNVFLKACRFLRLLHTPASNDIKHYLYYRMGFSYIYVGKYQLALKALKKAYSFAITPTNKGDALLDIGVVYKRQGKYKKAIDIYKQVIEVYGEDNPIPVSGVYNNIADVYFQMGNYKRALQNIQLAFDYLESRDMERFFVYFLTYSQIKIKQGKSKEDLDKMLSLLSKVKDFFLYKCFIIDGMHILNYIHADDAEYVDKLLQKLGHIIEDISKGDESFKQELKKCLTEVYLTLSTISASKLKI